MIIFLLFLAVPLIEIGLFITVGGWITLWPTLTLVVVTAVIGSAIVRFQGLGALQQVQHSLETLQDPTRPVAHGLLIAIAGIFLITPGFFTDALGFVLLVPAARGVLMRMMARHFLATRVETFHTPKPEDSIIDGDFSEVPPDDQTRLPPEGGAPRSGWTRP